MTLQLEAQDGKICVKKMHEIAILASKLDCSSDKAPIEGILVTVHCTAGTVHNSIRRKLTKLVILSYSNFTVSIDNESRYSDTILLEMHSNITAMKWLSTIVC